MPAGSLDTFNEVRRVMRYIITDFQHHGELEMKEHFTDYIGIQSVSLVGTDDVILHVIHSSLMKKSFETTATKEMKSLDRSSTKGSACGHCKCIGANAWVITKQLQRINEGRYSFNPI